METQERWSQLRAFLSLEPSAEVWAQLLELLMAWSQDNELAVAIDYAQEHMGTWPDVLRYGCFETNDRDGRGKAGAREHIVANHSRLPPGIYQCLGELAVADEIQLHPCWQLVRMVGIQRTFFGRIRLSAEGRDALQAMKRRHFQIALSLLANHERLCQVTGINALARHVDLTELEQLIEATQRLPLADLRLGDGTIGDEGVRLLVQASWAPQLRSLDIEQNNLTDDALDIIVQSQRLTRLECLHIIPNPAFVMPDYITNGNHITTQALFRLATSPLTTKALLLFLLPSLTVKQLIDIARERGLKGFSMKSKSQLINLISKDIRR